MPDRVAPLDRPNILFIITDHHAFAHHAAMRSPYMPRFEAFAAQGISFPRAYTVCPLCSPARASLMTGMYPSAHGMRWNSDSGICENRNDFAQGQLLFSHYLSRAGYRNSYVGKWHCGHTRLPSDYGMEGWSLPDYGDVYATDAYAQYAAERGLHEPVARVEHNPRLLEREGNLLRLGQPGPWQLIESSGVMEGLPESHESFFVAHMAAEKLRQLARAGQPFSLVASFWSPHHPYFPTEPYASMIDPAGIQEYPSFRDSLEGRPIRHFMHRDLHAPSASRWPEWATWRKILSRCYGQILQLDAAIGLVLDALESTGLSENTLVVCCADHGDALASHGGLWDKSATFTEEVGRIPLAVRWPARFRGGRCDALVSNMDCTATILEAAGVETPNGMHSRSLIPLCEDPGSPWPDHLVCEHNGHGEIVMTRILLSGRHKYVAALYDGDELYDLKNDPYETRNLIDDPACGQELARMRSLLIDHMESRGDSVGRRLLYSVKLKNREAR